MPGPGGVEGTRTGAEGIRSAGDSPILFGNDYPSPGECWYEESVW